MFFLVFIRFLSTETQLHCNLRDHTWNRLFFFLEGNQSLARLSFVAAQSVHSDPVTIAKGFPFTQHRASRLRLRCSHPAILYCFHRHQLYCKPRALFLPPSQQFVLWQSLMSCCGADWVVSVTACPSDKSVLNLLSDEAVKEARSHRLKRSWRQPQNQASPFRS